jgi:uncharacterized membrane protein
MFLSCGQVDAEKMQWKEFILAFFLIPLIDAPWLYYQMHSASPMFEAIQGGRSLSMRILPAIVVYIALAYLLVIQTSAWGAALSGAATYAVYDFTNMSLFKDYKLQFAVMDTLWGGLLFAIAFTVLKRLA